VIQNLPTSHHLAVWTCWVPVDNRWWCWMFRGSSVGCWRGSCAYKLLL